jgi:hypothetical protein
MGNEGLWQANSWMVVPSTTMTVQSKLRTVTS